LGEGLDKKSKMTDHHCMAAARQGGATEALDMPGRQRRMARKVAALERKLSELFAEFCELMPALYRERIQSHDPLSTQPVCAAWEGAWAGVTAAHEGLTALHKLLEARAANLPQAPCCPFVAAPESEI
jgi:hypothetical protein